MQVCVFTLCGISSLGRADRTVIVEFMKSHQVNRIQRLDFSPLMEPLVRQAEDSENLVVVEERKVFAELVEQIY